jgi:ppGpp synthetase/RelA/SpoT-type nucleotidyltranferase
MYPADWDNVLETINNWRSCHSYPLQAIKMTLLKRANTVAQAAKTKAIVAQRLKRLDSIWGKLRSKPNMSLTQMQDIGGCRAVMRSASQVERLLQLYESHIAKNSTVGPEVVERYDYINHPKESGYRSFHYVYKYRSSANHKLMYNGLRIEIQIRSRLQHAWATAVETVSVLTKQALKSNVGTDEWKRFFALMGTAIALRERTPVVPQTPNDPRALHDELMALSDQLRVRDTLNIYGHAVMEMTGQEKDAAAFLMVLDPVDQMIEVKAFQRTALLAAEQEYLEREKTLDKERGMQAVLVSAESVSLLKRAYPNFFLDTGAFLDALTIAIGKGT